MVAKCALLVLAVLHFTLFSTNAEAGRRGLRVDLGAWNAPAEISLGGGSGACPEAGWDAEVPVFEPGPTIFWGWVLWSDLRFVTSAFVGLSSFYCQTSRPYQPGASPDEYLNESIFPADEADLAAMIGNNADNAVTAIRYSFVGNPLGNAYGRQWAFYFFPGGRTVVALYGVEDDQQTYEYIWDTAAEIYVFNAQQHSWNGDYFCFDYGIYSGDCVTAPPPPEEIFADGFD
jgi:hypothetical protein